MSTLVRHIGIGWDKNHKGHHYLSIAVCDKIIDSEILCAFEINESNISKSIIDHIRGAIFAHKEDNPSFTFAINHSVNDDVKFKKEVIRKLKTNMSFREYNDSKDLLGTNRVFFEADSSSLPHKTKKKFEKYFPECIFSKKRGAAFEAEICSVIALCLQLD